jgi:hypothetical protein
MSHRTEYFRSKEAADAASDRARRRELRGSSSVRVISSAQRERWLYGPDGPDAWGFDAFATGLASDIKDAIAEYHWRMFRQREGFNDTEEIPL